MAPTTKHISACAQQAHAPPCKALHFPPCRSLNFIINWANPKHLPPKASFVVVKTFRFACESKAAGAGPRAQSCMAQTARQRAMMRATALHCKRQPPLRPTTRARPMVESGRQQHSSRSRGLLPRNHGSPFTPLFPSSDPAGRVTDSHPTCHLSTFATP